MSDYAGVIGGAVGAVIGSFVPGVGTAWGWAIGSALGNMYAVSQQVLPGPKIGDIQRQTSQEGGFRTIVFGRSQPFPGNVIADSEPVIVRKEESQGKGGPKVETEYAYRTYAVGFCEGETTLLQVWRNGILVYDVEDPSMAPENAKFLEYATWYTGSFDQMPDPDLEGIYGVNNTPFFRGTSYLVLASEDVTDQRGAWSQWQVRVFRGASKRVTSPPYPYLFGDALGVTAGVVGNEFDTLIQESALQDSVTVSATLVNAVITQPLQNYWFNDALEFNATLHAAEVRDIQQYFTIETTELAVSATLHSAEVKVVLVTMQPFQDRLVVTATLQGVTFQ